MQAERHEKIKEWQPEMLYSIIKGPIALDSLCPSRVTAISGNKLLVFTNNYVLFYYFCLNLLHMDYVIEFLEQNKRNLERGILDD